MDFQTHQEQAQQNTGRLIALLALGVIAIIAVVTLLLMGLLYYGSNEVQPLAAVAVAAPITTIAIVGTSLVKSSQIKSGGGSYVAASMGGRPVDFNTHDPAEKQLANVVEEIAIASGMPVPAVFVLDDEPGINAFAAGWSADNAAIGVTRGALQHFTRRELQGVIAHEFAHIRNGDTRIKTRIIGWVFGIAVLTVLGRMILHWVWWTPRRRDREDNSQMLMLAAGVGLLVVGSVGTLFARLVQAAVSRQREYLADASAVQYTRDPASIGEALMKIGGMGTDNRMRAPHAVEAGHLLFSTANGASLATHPPLEDRIRRILPDWDGEYKRSEPVQNRRAASKQPNGGRSGSRGRAQQPGQMLPGMPGIPGMPNLGLPVDVVGTGAVLSGSRPGPGSGNGGGRPASGASQPPPPPPQPDFASGFAPPSLNGPTEAHIDHARSLLARIPESTQSYLHTRQGAVAAVLGLLASGDPSTRQQQLAAASERIGIPAEHLDAAGRVISDMHRSLHLPAVDIALHSIRETPYDFRVELTDAIRQIESSSSDQDLFRWMLRRVLLRHLEGQHDDGSDRNKRRLNDLGDHAIAVYGVMAWFNSSGSEQTQGAFQAALSTVGGPSIPVPPIESLTFDRLDVALDALSELDRPGRHAFVEGATAAVLHDGRTTVEEAELIRVVADAVGLPVPPLLPA